MKEYNKEKLHEYAKELFALCLEKKILFEVNTIDNVFLIYDKNKGWCRVDIYNQNKVKSIIEKVKRL